MHSRLHRDLYSSHTCSIHSFIGYYHSMNILNWFNCSLWGMCRSSYTERFNWIDILPVMLIVFWHKMRAYVITFPLHTALQSYIFVWVLSLWRFIPFVLIWIMKWFQFYLIFRHGIYVGVIADNRAIRCWPSVPISNQKEIRRFIHGPSSECIEIGDNRKRLDFSKTSAFDTHSML